MKRTLIVAELIAASTLAACGGSQPSSSNTESTKPLGASAVTEARTPALGVYVTNETGGDLSVIDASSNAVVATIPLGKRPRGIVASPDRSLLYVALSGSPVAGPGVDESKLPPPDRKADGIGVVDLRQRKLIKVLPSGSDPEEVAISADGKQLYVANEDVGLLSVIDASDGTLVETFKVGGEPEGVTVEPQRQRVWVTSEEDGAVFVADLATHKTVAVKVGPRPRTIAFLPDGSRAYVPSENGATLTLIDTRKLAPVRTIDLGQGMRPMGTEVSPDGRFLYVSTGRSKMVLILDTSTNTVSASIEAGPRPWGIGLTPDAKMLYSANGPSNDVSVIDVTSRQVVKKIPVGRGPWGVAVVEAPGL
jgi:YVTN family beta-propeller protein